ncbi:AlbA family DNA-binding domain-containing protein [Mycolicibacterium pyrenivorans]|uniref:AlbA family DNA-binding domain-containing protein n=1 Tax=Mycolicibacterium pyrenivorans TaxID=187102 RepID=UPI0021F39601|nr:ATP-binding protein [Mycolicibacterium pyrenivorans]MCV7152406.1 ATP-binding protein [Mycolicibacterium pyrenivorans]
MSFTALHRSLGLPPGPLTDEILDAAITAGVVETDDLDWKSELPPVKGLPQTDFPKDIASMANSGGGMILYGVREDQKAATGRQDTGDLIEVHERALHSAAITAITPPVFGLEIHQLGTNPRAVAVIVPASVDGPHLIYRGEYFGAPIRNKADTVWMKERQIEAMYRARFDERRRATGELDALYTEAAAGRDSANRAWLIAVAHPRIPGALVRPTLEQAQAIFKQAETITLSYSNRNAMHPLENINRLNPRPGLRRWVAPNNATDAGALWREAWASVHHDGSVTLAAAVGGHRSGSDSNFEGWEVESRAIEAAVADFTAVIRATAATLNHGEYDTSVGVDWAGEKPLCVLTVDGMGFTYNGVSTPLSTYTPVRSIINATSSDADFHQQVYELAQDCVNQGGVTNLHVVAVPELREA